MGLFIAMNNKSKWNALSEFILQRVSLFVAMLLAERAKNVTGEIL